MIRELVDRVRAWFRPDVRLEVRENEEGELEIVAVRVDQDD